MSKKSLDVQQKRLRIKDRLIEIDTSLRFQNKVGDYDVNKRCQTFFLELLNIIFSLKLEDLDHKYDRVNFPVFDLGDEKNRAGFQITSEKSKSKIDDTFKTYLKEVKKDKRLKKFSHIRFVILTKEKIDLYGKSYNIPAGLSFDPANDILTLMDLFKHVTIISNPKKISKIFVLLNEELGYGGIASSERNIEEDFGIIGEIISNLLKSKVEKEISREVLTAYIGLTEKLSLNFDNKKSFETAFELFVNNWGYKQSIEDYLKEIDDPVRVKSMISKVQQDFTRLKKSDAYFEKIEDVNILHSMADIYVPKSKKNNPEYRSFSMGIVLNLFERCKFGEKRKDESTIVS